MHARRIPGLPPVAVQRRSFEGRKASAMGPTGQGPVVIGHRVGGDHALGQRGGLGKEGPVIGLQRQFRVPRSPEIRGRHDLDDAKPVDPLRVIQRHAVGHPGAPVVPQHMRPFEPHEIHQADDVARHLSLGIGVMVGVVGRGIAVAISAQVGNDDVEIARQRGRDLGPAHVVLRIAMQADQRRPFAALVHRQPDTIGINETLGKPFDVRHGRSSCRAE